MERTGQITRDSSPKEKENGSVLLSRGERKPGAILANGRDAFFFFVVAVVSLLAALARLVHTGGINKGTCGKITKLHAQSLSCVETFCTEYQRY